VNPNLLFTATEFALFFTLDGGQKWVKLSGDAPTIAFRDVTIQRREDDLVAASFGRGFFIVDDISPLRELTEASLEQQAMLFPGRDALWYIEKPELAFSRGGSQGNGYFRAPNPEFGANFTYYLGEDIKSLAELRRDREKPVIAEGGDTPLPSFESLTTELQEDKPVIWLTVRDSDGNVVRRISGPTKKGFHRVNWNLRFPDTSFARPTRGDNEPSGFLVPPGQYTVEMSSRVRGQTTQLVGPQSFNVKPLREQGALPDQPDAFEFRAAVTELNRSVTATAQTLSEAERLVGLLEVAVARTPGGDPEVFDNRLTSIKAELHALDGLLNGNEARNELAERTLPTVRSRLGRVNFGMFGSTYGPTQTHREQFGYAQSEYGAIKARVEALVESAIPAFEAELIAAGAPWVPGGRIP